jgi:hypothetical protein
MDCEKRRRKKVDIVPVNSKVNAAVTVICLRYVSVFFMDMARMVEASIPSIMMRIIIWAKAKTREYFPYWSGPSNRPIKIESTKAIKDESPPPIREKLRLFKKYLMVEPMGWPKTLA